MDPMIDGKEIPGYPAYRITPDGQVWTCWKRLAPGKGHVLGSSFRMMKQGHNQYGHKVVGLNRGDGSGQHRKSVHRIVLEVFVGPCPREGMQCRHDDGNPANNNVSNLLWGTPQENQWDRKRHGTSMEGEKHPGVRRTKKQVLSIIAELDAGAKQIEVARKYNVTQGYISNIYRRKIWKCLKETP